jgi:sugar lactone lactonase YvrE
MFHHCSKRYIRLYSILLCCAAVIQTFACADRQRLNPLDPQNPATLGQPTGLSVISWRDTVTLHWDKLALRDLNGVRVYRRLQGESRFSPIAIVPPTINSFRDLRVTFGLMHAYRIAAVATDFESLSSDSVQITPGPAFSWVADAGSGDLIILSHDGQHEVLRISAFGQPQRLEIDARRGQVWVLDRFGGEFGRVAMDGRRSLNSKRIYGPLDLAIDQLDGSVWVSDSLANGLMKFDSTGVLIKSLESYKKLVALAVHPQTSDLWAVDRITSRVLIFSRTGEFRRDVPVALQRPTDIDIDARSGKIWIADGQRVWRLDARGEAEQLATPTFRLAYRLAADENSGGCWLIDYSTAIRNSDIIKLAATGEALFTNKGFDLPQNLAVNPYDGSCLVADFGNGRVVRLAANGRVLGSYENVFSPVDVDTAQ